MFDTLFGAEMPLAVRFFLAFLIVLGLIGATAWAVRRFGAGRLGANTRGRQPRLAVVDYASVDGRRRLILVRRDNIEHLMMIGGPTDVVVEANIVRAVAAPRDLAGTRPTAGLDALPRAIPLPENGNGSWPLAPEPSAGSRASSRVEPLPDEISRSFAPISDLASPADLPSPAATGFAKTGAPARPQRDTLSALADELSTRPAAPHRRPAATRPQVEEPEARQEPRSEPRIEARRPMPQPATPAPAPLTDDSDQSLADMAQRLEAALRKPGGENARVAPPPRAESASAAEPAAPSPPPRAPRPEARPARAAAGADAKPNQSKLYDSLEQEMASLLGRPTKP
jgi:flagellar protein FliO/FliZ